MKIEERRIIIASGYDFLMCQYWFSYIWAGESCFFILTDRDAYDIMKYTLSDHMSIVTQGVGFATALLEALCMIKGVDKNW